MLSDAYDVLMNKATEYCDEDYYEAIIESSIILRKVINCINSMPYENEVK